MKLIELISKRQSERGYKNEPVEKDKILRCVEAARLAPSACNSQPWHFIVVDNQEIKNEVAKSTANRLLPLNHFTNQAPVHVVVVNEGSNMKANIGNVVKNRNFSLIDIGIAVEHFCLQAIEEGLGTCILGWFDEKKVREILHIPKRKRVELIITVGYPASEKLRPKKRKDNQEIVSFNSYS